MIITNTQKARFGYGMKWLGHCITLGKKPMTARPSRTVRKNRTTASMQRTHRARYGSVVVFLIHTANIRYTIGIPMGLLTSWSVVMSQRPSHRRKLTDAFNKRYGTHIKEDAIVMRCWQKGYKPATDGKFKNGSVPWEKTDGGKEAYMKTLPRAPLGKEYIMKGHVYVLTEEGRKPKRRVVWEQHYGKLNSGECIIFADGDTTNFDINNLRKVSNSTQATLYQNGWVGFAPIVDAGITWCKLRDLLGKEYDEHL